MGEAGTMDGIETIEEGITNESKILEYAFSNQEYDTLPDGEYIFWIVLLEYGEDHFNSIRYRLSIRK